MQDHRPASPCLVLLELLNEVVFLSRFLIPLFRRPQTRYGIDIRSQSSSSVRALDEKMLVIIGMLTFKGVAVGSTQERRTSDRRRPRESERHKMASSLSLLTAESRGGILSLCLSHFLF